MTIPAQIVLMKYTLLILSLFLCSISSATANSNKRNYADLEEFGKLYSYEYYVDLLKDLALPVADRSPGILSSCKEELKRSNEQCIELDRYEEPCFKEKGDEVNFVMENVSYCAASDGKELSLSKSLNTFFAFRKTTLEDSKLIKQYKNMFYSGLNCAKAFYKTQGIKLDIDIVEMSDNKETELTVIELARRSSSHDVIGLGDGIGRWDHQTLCQIIADELTHHFAVPDRYQRFYRSQECNLQEVYPEETLMATHGRKGYEGYTTLTF